MLNKKIIFLLLIGIIFLQSVSAGVGIKWDRESALAEGGEKACLSYGVYNPWDEDTYVGVGVSDELKDVLIVQDVNATLIPAHTPSKNSIPVEFCFEVPRGVYEKNCWFGDFFVCEQGCKENLKVYEGEVEVKSVPPPSGGGSTAIMAVSAPLRVRVACTPFERDYTLIYIIFGILTIIAIVLIIKYRKPREERIKEKMRALKDSLKSEKKKK